MKMLVLLLLKKITFFLTKSLNLYLILGEKSLSFDFWSWFLVSSPCQELLSIPKTPGQKDEMGRQDASVGLAWCQGNAAVICRGWPDHRDDRLGARGCRWRGGCVMVDIGWGNPPGTVGRRPTTRWRPGSFEDHSGSLEQVCHLCGRQQGPLVRSTFLFSEVPNALCHSKPEDVL